MPTELHLVPDMEDAQTRLLAAIADGQRSDPLARFHVLLPTRAAIRDTQRRLASSERSAVGGVRLLEFYALAQAIADAAGRPEQEIGDLALRRLSVRVIRDMAAAGDLTSFAPVRNSAGFRELLVRFVREMKTQGISPAHWRRYALRTSSERDRQLAEFYERYQRALDDMTAADADGLLWLAAEALEDDAGLLAGGGPLHVLGFDQFSPVQLRILKAMGRRLPALVIYLRWDATRTPDSLALSRLQRTRSELMDALQPQERVWAPEDGSGSSATLSYVGRNIFEPAQASEDPQEQIRFVAAPSREGEVRWALRDAKRLLLEGERGDRIALLVPRREAYDPLIRTVALEYGVPVASAAPLAEQPMLIAFFNLLSLYPDFAWRPVLDALRSPYVQQPWLTGEQIDHLDRLTRERPVIAGREQWSEALTPLAAGFSGLDAAQVYDERAPAPFAAALGNDYLVALQAALERLFLWLTPPSTATHWDYTQWLQEAILGLLPAVAEDDSAGDLPGSDRTQREKASFGLPAGGEPLAESWSEWPVGRECEERALGGLLDALRKLLAAAQLVPPDAADHISWAEYVTELRDVVAASSIEFASAQGGIRFGPLEDARALSVDHIYVLGLSEGELPRVPVADPLFSRQEREAHPLPLVRQDPGSEATLWWEVIGAARSRLTLLRPRLDESGAEWLPSPYWQAVVALIAGGEGTIVTPRIDAMPPPDEAASVGEYLASLAILGAEQNAAFLADRCRAVGVAGAVAAERAASAPPGIWEGVLRDEELLSDLDGRFGAGQPWSASRLNAYGLCPYRFFGEFVLSLEPLPDPAEGFDVLQRGTLLHALLERTYRSMTVDGVAPGETDLQIAIAHLDRSCDEILPDAPGTYGFRSGPFWEREKRELHRLLRALIEWEWDPARAAGYRPYLQELRFGMRGAEKPPLTLRGGGAAPGGLKAVTLRGAIDRIDRSPAGDLRVIDYKSGSEGYSSADLAEGRALQSALYALAAERLLAGMHVTESYYLHIPRRAISGKVRPSGELEAEPVVAAAVERAVAFADAALAGWFPAGPSKPGFGSTACSATCDFSRLCRVDRRSIYKARRFSPAGAAFEANGWRCPRIGGDVA